MKFCLLKSCPALLLLLCLQISLPAESVRAAEPEPYTLTVVTDREDALYEVGEEATFLISVRSGKTIINEPTMGHAAPSHIHKAFMDYILERVQRSAAVPAP